MIQVFHGDITILQVDAIVSAANALLLGGSSVGSSVAICAIGIRYKGRRFRLLLGNCRWCTHDLV